MIITQNPTVLTPLAAYMALPEGAPYQLIEGELVMSPAPKFIHNRVSKRFFKLLDQFVESNNLGEVADAPNDVHLSEENVVQPDVFFISKIRSYIIQDYIMGAPDLVMEVLSPRTAKYDTGEKKDVYARFGVKEYWIVEPAQKWIQLHTLEKDSYVLRHELTGMGTIASVLLPGFTIEWAGLFE